MNTFYFLKELKTNLKNIPSNIHITYFYGVSLVHSLGIEVSWQVLFGDEGSPDSNIVSARACNLGRSGVDASRLVHPSARRKCNRSVDPNSLTSPHHRICLHCQSRPAVWILRSRLEIFLLQCACPTSWPHLLQWLWIRSLLAQASTSACQPHQLCPDSVISPRNPPGFLVPPAQP